MPPNKSAVIGLEGGDKASNAFVGAGDTGDDVSSTMSGAMVPP